MVVNGTLSIGSPTCPIQSPITVAVPGGDDTFGIDANQGATLDIHGTVVVSGRGGRGEGGARKIGCARRR